MTVKESSSSLLVFSAFTYSSTLSYDMFKFVWLSSLMAVALAQQYNCYSDGHGPASDCARFISKFCADVSAQTIVSGDAVSNCFVFNDNTRCELWAYNSRNIDAKPNRNNCENILSYLANNCYPGGEGTVGPNSYTFAVDSNSGRCAAHGQPGN